MILNFKCATCSTWITLRCVYAPALFVHVQTLRNIYMLKQQRYRHSIRRSRLGPVYSGKDNRDGDFGKAVFIGTAGGVEAAVLSARKLEMYTLIVFAQISYALFVRCKLPSDESPAAR